MPERRLPHLQHERTRHGRMIWYVRVKRGQRIRLTAVFGSPEFLAEYRAAIENKPLHVATKAAGGTLKWLVETYMASPDWAATAGETRKQFGYQFRRILETSPDAAIGSISKRHIVEGRDRRSRTPSDANKFVKASRKLFAWALEREMIEANPAANVKLVELPNADEGFHTWTV